jgi:hypothetical protein
MTNDHDTNVGTIKIVVAWLLATIGSVTLNEIAVVSTIVFTVLQSFFLIRDKWWRERR